MLFCMWDAAYKRTLAANPKKVAYNVLSGLFPYVRRHTTVNKKCFECVVKYKFPSFMHNSHFFFVFVFLVVLYRFLCSFVATRITISSSSSSYWCYWYSSSSSSSSACGARCSSVVKSFAHGTMGRRIDPSWGGPIELFLVPASTPRLV